MAPAGEADIGLLIQDVVGASRIPPKARLADIKPTVARLASLAYERGLLPDALAQLVHLAAAPSLLDQASLNALVRSLYPRTRVSRAVVVRVVAALGHGALKPSLNLQAALLRWLVMVFHVLEDRLVLARAYPVLFNLLDTVAIRPQLAQLLALVTRRRNVRPFRIQALLALSRQTGNDPGLVGLLRVYKDYYPEIIVGEAVRGKASAFKHPDVQWRSRLDEIQEAHLRDAEERSVPGPREGFRVNRPVNRSARHRLVPIVQTSQATEDSVTLEEIDSVTGLVQNLERLELPNQLVAVVADPLLQKLTVLRPAAEAHQRVANWLGAVLRDYIDGDADEETLWEMLDLMRDYIVQTRTFPALFEFCAQFLETWSGQGRRKLVLDILGHVPFGDFQELHKHIFGPLETAVLDDSPASLLAMLDLYTKLLHNWTTALRSGDGVPARASDVLAQLVRHAGRLALCVLQTAAGAAGEAAVVSFYEQTVRLVADDGLRQYVRIELPPSTLVYTLLFSASLATVSRLCQVLACYKRGFEAAMSTKARHDGSGRIDMQSYDRAYVNRYNGFLMDMCNCFWRARAFSDSDTNARGCMVPRAAVSALEAYVVAVDRAASLASLLSLSHAPALCLLSIRRVRDLEEDALRTDAAALSARHAGPVTQASLAKLAAAGGIRLGWQDYRIDVLRSLSDKGLPGVTELLKNTMTVLKNSMEGGKSGTQSRSSQVQASQ